MNRELFFNNAGDERGTPQALFDRYHAKYDFNLDVAAGPLNHKCELYLGEGGFDFDGLNFDWTPFRAWMNPPYSTITTWVNKAASTGKMGGFVCGLLPVRTDTKYWHECVWDSDFHRPYEGVTIEFLKGRLSFELHTTPEQRAIIKDLEGNMEMKDIIEFSGLPKMAIEGIWKDYPDEDLLGGAPFPSCIVTWGKP
jgi:phage N-6-adenine-methyltransferase